VKGKSNANAARKQPRAGAEKASRDLRAQQTETAKVVPVRTAWNLPAPQDPPLIRLLFKEALRRQHRLVDMSQSLGVTYGYLAQLRSGHRLTENISQQFAEACARYLEVPTALVKLLAGSISMRDFHWPSRSRRKDVQDGLRSLRDDPAVAGWIPDALFSADDEVQDFVWSLYQESSGMSSEGLRLMPAALDFLQRAALGEADYELRVAKMREEAAADWPTDLQ